VLFELVINVIATAVLLLYTQTGDHFAGLAADPTADLASLRSPSFVIHGALALLVLVAALVLAVYKPKGLTGYGQRLVDQRLDGAETRPVAAPVGD
jgi:hypothetical protein